MCFLLVMTGNEKILHIFFYKKEGREIFKRAENLGRFNQVKRPGFDG